MVHDVYRPFGKYLKGFSTYDGVNYHPVFLEREEQLNERTFNNSRSPGMNEPGTSADNLETQAVSFHGVCDFSEESIHVENDGTVNDKCTNVSFASSEDEKLIEEYHKEFINVMNEDSDETFFTSSCTPRDLLEEFNMSELEVNETKDHNLEKGLFNMI